ncbi:MAG: hypothetical protein JMDDDDMK_03264 [Acidobacteria bacterium]|nr:hypothetical protein [Acidobacteriota bacterium]
MMKAFKKITFTLLISSALALNGFALPGDNWQKPKDKPPEQPKERDKSKGGDERGGGKDDKKPKDKKPDGGFFS